MKTDKVFLVLFCILFPILLLILSYNVTLLFFPLTDNQQITINHLTKNTNLTLNYTALEASHLEDVNKVMLMINLTFYVSWLFCLLVLMFYRKNKEQLRKFFRYGGIVTIIEVLLIGLMLLLNFEFIFTLFHNVFFPQGNWTFPLNSLLILTFPEAFFFKLSLIIFGLALLFGSLFILLSVYLNKNGSIAKEN